MSYQKITIVGNVGNNATTQVINERNVLNISVGVSKNWTNSSGEKQSSTTWFSVSKWSDKSFDNLAKYITKGTMVLITGEVSAKTYQNQQNQTLAQLQINADEIKLLGSSQKQETQQGSSEAFNKFVSETKSDGDLAF